MKKLIVICAAGVLLFASSNVFGVWTEIGDAGDTPGTAQEPIGSGPLTTIEGALPGNSDADIFKIYIVDPANFSAHAAAYEKTQLFLFDETGMGIYGDDTRGGSNTYLPPGNTYSPTTAGIYYLGMSFVSRDPESPDGRIFRWDTTDDILTPTGPGGGKAVSHWLGSGGSICYDDNYTITLTGTSYYTPAPGAILLAGIGIGLISWLRRHRIL